MFTFKVTKTCKECNAFVKLYYIIKSLSDMLIAILIAKCRNNSEGLA